MGRIVTSVSIDNVGSAGASRKIDILVDTGASYLTLPVAWKQSLGEFDSEQTVELQTATQETIQGTICGPAKIQVEGFRAIYSEVLFINMEPENGEYEPLLGYIPLEQCGAAIDMVGHRLLPVKYMDLK